MPLESRDFESEISQHPCYKLQTRHEDIQGFKHLMPSRYFDANSNYVWQLDPRFHSVVTGLTCFTEYVLTHTFNNFCLKVS